MPDNDAANTGGSSTPPSGDANAPRPRRTPPVYKPTTETFSLQPIGGGPPQAAGAPPAAAPIVPPPPGGAPAPIPAPTPAAVPPPPRGMAGLTQPGGAPAAAPPPAAPAPAPSSLSGKSNGLAQIGGGGAPLSGAAPAPAAPIVPPPPGDPLASLNTHPDTGNQYLKSNRPDLDNRPLNSLNGSGGYVEPGSFDAGKAAMIGGGIVAVLAVVWLLSIMIVPATPAPTAFTTYSTSTNAFSIDRPTDWNMKAQDTAREDSATGQKYTAEADGAEFWSGKAAVNVWTDLGMNAMQDQLLSGQGYTPGGVIETQHKKFIDQMKKRVSSFESIKDEGIVLPGFGAKITEYTGTSGFLGLSGKGHGYAATIQGPKHMMTIALQSPEKSWETLKPAYLRMMLSVKLDGLGAADIQQRLGGMGGMGAGMGGGINIPGAGSVPMPSGGGM